MADDGAPFIVSRPQRISRFFYLSPGEARDVKTLESLVSATLAECRDALLIDDRAARMLAAIGRTGREGHIKALEGYISDRIAERLHNPPQRQRVKGAFIRYDCVPQPRKGQVYGTLRVYAWTHTLRTTFDIDLRTHR